MKRIKGLITSIILLLVIVITPKVNASSVTLETNKTAMQAGEEATLTLNMNALVYNYQFSGGISDTETNIYTLDENDLTNKNFTKTFTFKPTVDGTYIQ